MNEPIKIKMVFQPKDINKATWWLVRNRVYAVTAVLVGLLLALTAADIVSFRPELLVVGILSGPATAAFLWWLQTNNVAIQARSCEITLDENGMSVLPDNAPTAARRVWGEFKVVNESRDAFIFVTEDKQIFPLLKRDLVHLDEIRDLINRHLGDKAHLGSTSV